MSAAAECVIIYGGEPTHSVSIMEFARGFVAHETQYFAEGLTCFGSGTVHF